MSTINTSPSPTSNTTISPEDKIIEGRKALYDIYANEDQRSILKDFINMKYFQLIENFQNDNSIENEEYSENYKTTLKTVSNKLGEKIGIINESDDTTVEKIKKYLESKLESKQGDFSTKNHINNSPEHHIASNRLDTMLNKILKDDFLSAEEKEVKHQIKNDPDYDKEDSSSTIENSINTKSTDTSSEELSEQADNSLEDINSENKTAEVTSNNTSKIGSDQKTEANDKLNETTTNTISGNENIQTEDPITTITETIEEVTNLDSTEVKQDEIIEDEVTEKKWPLPIRFFLSILKGIGYFFSKIFSLIKAPFSRG